MQAECKGRTRCRQSAKVRKGVCRQSVKAGKDGCRQSAKAEVQAECKGWKQQHRRGMWAGICWHLWPSSQDCAGAHMGSKWHNSYIMMNAQC